MYPLTSPKMLLAISALAVMTVSTMSTTSVQARVNTNNLTCAQAKSLVRSSGAVVLSTGRYTYERYVAGAGYCSYGEFIKRASVPTRDRKSCSIGYLCTNENPWGFINRFPHQFNN